MVKINHNNDRVKLFSSFIKRGKHIFRHSTYLQFGESKEIIGGCVLCNPGSLTLKDVKSISNLEDGEKVNGRCKMDPTMKQLRTIIENTHGENVSGKFYIYNLFTLKNGGMAEATNYYKKLIRDNEYEELLDKDFNDFKDNAHKLPWVLISWGCSGAKVLTEKKEEWNRFIKENDMVSIGVESIQNPVFYKSLYQTGNKQMLEIQEELEEQINNLLSKSKS